MSVLVMKFGGAAVATPQHFSQIADLIIARRQEFAKIVVVVSAMGKTTDQLIQLAQEVHPHPPQREYDMLISVGERISMSLLAMALCRKNQAAVSFTGSQAGIVTTPDHANAQILDVRPHRVMDNLEQGKIVIIAGFQGVSEAKEITTLGRGGSDTTAVALGVALGAQKVEFYKDVPGVFDQDPKQNECAHFYPHLNYQAALDIVNQGARILHPRAIQLAAKNYLLLHVRSFMPLHQDHSGTLIFDETTSQVNRPLYEISERVEVDLCQTL